MNQVNKTMYEGYLVADPVVRITGTEKVVANFTVASNRWYAGEGDDVKKAVTFLKVVAWEMLGVKAQGFGKGDRIKLMGHLANNRWTGNDGFTRDEIVLKADEIFEEVAV